MESFSLQSTSSITATLASEFNPTSFLDAKVFATLYQSETDIISSFELFSVKGAGYVNFLYSYRSISKAIPEIVSDINHPNDVASKRAELNSHIVSLLGPFMSKVKDAVMFVKDAVDHIRKFVAHVASSSSVAMSSIYEDLIALLDILVVLDALKDTRASLGRDFVRYKRALGSKLSREQLEDVNILQMFLSNPDPTKAKNFVIATLREEVKKIRGHEDVLSEVLDFCEESINRDEFLSADHKFRFLRALPHLLVLIDGYSTGSKSLNVFQQRKKGIASLQKIFRRYPFVPLYADMPPLSLVTVLELATHYVSELMGSAWGEGTLNERGGADKLAAEYSLTAHWRDIRSAHAQLLTLFAGFTNRLTHTPASAPVPPPLEKKGNSNIPDNEVLGAEAFSLAVDVLLSLARWQALLREAVAWKYAHPCTLATVSALGGKGDGEGVQYEQVLRYNLTLEERYVFADTISMIKSLSSLLSAKEATFAPLLRLHMHGSVQQLVFGELLPLMHRVDKRSKSSKTDDMVALLQMRDLVRDSGSDGDRTRDVDIKNYSRKQGSVAAPHPPRAVAPTPTQLRLLQMLLTGVVHEKSALRQRSGLLMMSKADLEKEDIKAIERWLRDSSFYNSLLNLGECLRSLSDLSDLWYREFYLELTGCVQFPMEMSLPWLLASALVPMGTVFRDELEENKNDSGANKVVSCVPVVGNLLYVLDIYNDAMHRGLDGFAQQHLVNEAQAEGTLALNQLAFSLADTIYTHAKQGAASAALDAASRRKFEELKGVGTLNTEQGYWDFLVSQKNVRLVGRSVDLCDRVSRRINENFYFDIDTAIRRFESSDITGIIDLQSILGILRVTHAGFTHTRTHTLQLDEFDCMVEEVDEAVHLAISAVGGGRICTHILRTVLLDLVPNFSYNSHTKRFTRSPPLGLLGAMRELLEVGKSPKLSTLEAMYGSPTYYRAHDGASRLCHGFVGMIHIEAILTLRGCRDVVALIEECALQLREALQKLNQYLPPLACALPKSSKLPRVALKTRGCYDSIADTLRDLMDYDDLKPDVFQILRVIGNIVLFMKDVSDAVDAHDQLQFSCLAPPMGVQQPSSADWDSLRPSDTTLGSALLGSSDATDTIGRQLLDSFLLRNHKEESVFVYILSVIEASLTPLRRREDSHWDTGVLPHASPSSLGFHRLWSALNFVFCKPCSDTAAAGGAISSPDEAEFGDGFAMGGCVLLHLLRQREVFEAGDFSYFLLLVKDFDAKVAASTVDVTSGTTLAASQNTVSYGASERDVSLFSAAATHQRSLHMQMFAILSAAVSSSSVPAHNRLMTFHPPKSD